MTLEIIAEVAQGFEGKSEQAQLLLKAAISTGADAVKYQMVFADELATPDYEHYALFKSLEMPDDSWETLAKLSSAGNIKLYCDIFGPRSLALAERLKLTAVKLHGTDIANVGFLNEVASSSIPKVLLGAGGAYFSEIERAIEILQKKFVVVMLGFQGYPTPTESNSISRINYLSHRLKGSGRRLVFGFSDHDDTESPLSVALAAIGIGAGAEVIEKHLTLGKIMRLEDFESALNPDEFREFCDVIRGCALAMGDTSDSDDFGMCDEELDYRSKIRRHVVTRKAIPAGMRLAASDLTLKRSSIENAISNLELAYGRVVKRDLEENIPLSQRDIE